MTTTTGTHEASRYALPNDDPQGLLRLLQLADILDDDSTDVLTHQGIAAGWQCLEIGAGAGTITAWMADQVGPTGHVTALDTDPRHIRLTMDNVTVRTGDVRTTPLPAAHYDLIYARLVLLHVAEREPELQRLVTALKPGGRLVVSDWDATWLGMLLHAPSKDAADAFDAFQTALRCILEENGADVGWARRVPLAMRAAGLVDIDTMAHNRLWAGGRSGCLLHVTNAAQLRDQLLRRGVTAAQLDLLAEAMHHPDTLAYCYWMFTTVGRRPEK
jgi:SAM-dependent methyltransferase